MSVTELRRRVIVDSVTSPVESDTVYFRGVARQIANERLVELLSVVAVPLEVDLTRRDRFGTVWAKYGSIVDAHETILSLHQRVEGGSSLSARFELGVDGSGKPIVPRVSHNTVIRSVLYNGCPVTSCPHSIAGQSMCGTCAQLAPRDSLNYTSKSVIVNGSLEVPFPSGLYLTRLITLTRQTGLDDPLADLLTNTHLIVSEQTRYSKEISEAMAMVDAVERAVKLAFKSSSADIHKIFKAVRVFVLGDGKYPLCAAALCLSMPTTWTFSSIDPLLEPVNLKTKYDGRFEQFSGYSQDFPIPDISDVLESTLSLVVACHSHAPLQEFWDRLEGQHRLAVTMPCCADYSHLNRDALCQFEDFEVYSAKRRISIYMSNR